MKRKCHLNYEAGGHAVTLIVERLTVRPRALQSVFRGPAAAAAAAAGVASPVGSCPSHFVSRERRAGLMGNDTLLADTVTPDSSVR